MWHHSLVSESVERQSFLYTGWVKKSKLLLLSKYVYKTEKIGGMWTKKNSYRENEVLSDIFT